MSDRIVRKVFCDGKCNGSPTSTLYDDQYNTERCDICSEILSYQRPESKLSKKKQPKSEQKTVRKVIHEVTIEQNPNSVIEVGKIYAEKWQDTVRRMPDKFVDYVFTSPPYNIGTGIDGNKYKDFSDNSSQQLYYEDQANLISSLLRVTRKHIFYNNQLLTNNRNSILMLASHFQKNLKEIVIWNKKKVAPASAQGVMNSKFEIILVFSNEEPEKRSFSDVKFHGTFDNVIELKGHDKNEFADTNKAVFPLPLPRKFVNTFGQEGDIWYDPYGGTGTTAVAAILEKRNWIISEMSIDQCKKVTAPRIRKHLEQFRLDLL